MLKFRETLLITIIAIAGILTSCEEKFGFDEKTVTPAGIYNSQRLVSGETRRAMILYSAGFNDISSYLADDIEDFQTGYLPYGGRNDNLIFIVSKQPVKAKSFTVPTSPVIIRLYKDRDNNPVMDTLLTMSTSAMAASATTLNEALTFIKDNYPAKSYGIVMSSHATGWLPKGYYNGSSASTSSVHLMQMKEESNLPPVKSFGQDVDGSGIYFKKYYEINLDELAKAFPMHMEYLLFDACLMGGIEVAYELKDVADKIGFSPTEVLAYGFDYTTLAERLIGSQEADPMQVCKDYFDYYAAQTGPSQSATFTLVDSKNLDALAAECKTMFETYRTKISTLNPDIVQEYFRYDKHWFYDLEDILLKSGASSSEMQGFYKAIDSCILYKAATASFIDSFDINTYSGFSMYLPSNGNATLNSFYSKLEWNKATLLVK